MTTNFHFNLRVFRNKKEMTQQQVAANLNITRARYSKYEEGSSEPPLFLLLRISKFYNVSIEKLIN